MQVSSGGNNNGGARNSRNGYQQSATNTTYANSGNQKLLNSTHDQRGISGGNRNPTSATGPHYILNSGSNKNGGIDDE
jgi:hypothetical protein